RLRSISDEMNNKVTSKTGLEPKDSREDLRQADQDLEEAEEQLAKVHEKAKNDLESIQQEKFEQALIALLEHQKKLLDETMRLEDLKPQLGEFSTGELASLKRLAEEQAQLHRDTSTLAVDPLGIGAIKFA